MSVTKQVDDFLFFILLGIIISCIFDIFRTLRKVQKKNSIYVVAIQDIIFFSIATIITTIYMIKIIDDRVRWYMFFAIALGIVISRKILSKLLIKIYSIIYYSLEGIIKFLCVPLELWSVVFCKIVKKIFGKCCKLFLYMIHFNCKLLSKFGRKNNFEKKRGLKNEKRTSKKWKKNFQKIKKNS